MGESPYRRAWHGPWTLHLRLTPSEAAAIDNAVQREGLPNRSEWLRRAISFRLLMDR